MVLDDILDGRAYERERDEFRRGVIDLKRRRRVGIGPIVTLVFECRDTVRFQIQEMARAERMLTDEAIQGELDAYNPLIPAPGELSATMFIELISEAELRRWLPALVGIERSVAMRLGLGGDAERVTAAPEAAHAAQLTRDDTTASVHYLRFALTPPQIDAFDRGPVALLVDHPAYRESTTLGAEVRAELLGDLRPA